MNRIEKFGQYVATGLIAIGLLCLVIFIVVSPPSVDRQLQAVIDQQQLKPFDPGPAHEPDKVALGQALFFDKLLSGNQDISCATCHHPLENTGDSLPVSIGTGGLGLGQERQLGHGRTLIPRNAPELWNRKTPEWTTMFWDSRVALAMDGSYLSPAGDQLPAGLDSVLAVQAMFPVTSRDEMRGLETDIATMSQENELCVIPDDDFTAMWQALTDRLLANDDYRAMFQAAYPDTPIEEMGFQHAANAIAAFEAEAFTLTNSPWNRYLTGDSNALPENAKRGALLFYGQAGCVRCHSGGLLTDQQHHNLAVPQVGPGKGSEAPLDYGRARETKLASDKFAFRTPSLHNVAYNAPYMHNGAYATLEAAVRHHLDPEIALRTYDPTRHLIPAMQDSFQNDEALLNEMLATLDPQVRPLQPLDAQDIRDLIAFLQMLTDPAVEEIDQFVPTSGPSGLPVQEEPVALK